jgi:hypothetical protein
LIWLLIALATLGQLLPHPFNITPLGALGLFAGACLPGRTAWLVPVGGLTLAGVLLGFYDPVVMTFVYLGFLAGPMVGHFTLSSGVSTGRVGGAVLANALVFFLLSNLGMWLSGLTPWPMTADGLLACYVAGLPAFWPTLAGDAAFATLLFGGSALLRPASYPHPARLTQ